MARKSMNVNLVIDGLKETRRKLRDMPKVAKDALKDHAGELAGYLARKAEGRARSDRSPQAKRVAQSITVMRGTEPVIKAGDSRRIASSRVPAYKLLFGSEFGSNNLKQFGKRHQGRQGSWFFGTVEDQGKEIADAWNEAAETVVEEFGKGGA